MFIKKTKLLKYVPIENFRIYFIIFWNIKSVPHWGFSKHFLSAVNSLNWVSKIQFMIRIFFFITICFTQKRRSESKRFSKILWRFCPLVLYRGSALDSLLIFSCLWPSTNSVWNARSLLWLSAWKKPWCSIFTTRGWTHT